MSPLQSAVLAAVLLYLVVEMAHWYIGRNTKKETDRHWEDWENACLNHEDYHWQRIQRIEDLLK